MNLIVRYPGHLGSVILKDRVGGAIVFRLKQGHLRQTFKEEYQTFLNGGSVEDAIGKCKMVLISQKLPRLIEILCKQVELGQFWPDKEHKMVKLENDFSVE